jgi:hypothetical protein
VSEREEIGGWWQRRKIHLPLSVNDLLVLLRVVNTDLRVLSLGLQLELDVEDQHSRAGELLGLLLKPSVGKCLFERHALNQHGISNRSTRHLLDANHLQVDVAVQRHDGVDNHLGEENLCGGAGRVCDFSARERERKRANERSNERKKERKEKKHTFWSLMSLELSVVERKRKRKRAKERKKERKKAKKREKHTTHTTHAPFGR